MKKLNRKQGLSVLLATGLVVSTTSLAVVACQAAVEQERDTKIYTRAYTSLPLYWNPTHTQNERDWQFLADLYAGSLGVDEYGRIYGDIFESGYAEYDSSSETTPSQFVGKAAGDQDFDQWTYKIRENANWYAADGNPIRSIAPSDYKRTAIYVLNKNNATPLTGLWTTFVSGASSIYQALGPILQYQNLNPTYFTEGSTLTIEEQAFDKLVELLNNGQDITYNVEEKIAGSDVAVTKPKTIKFDSKLVPYGFGLKLNDEDRTVQFLLSKKASFFETVLTYNAFQPTPIEFYGKGVAKDGPLGVYSGAYIPDGNIDTARGFTFKKNENYHFAAKTTIEKLKWINIVKNSTTSKTREMFEANEIDGFNVSQNDSTGWNKYVGSDWTNPKDERVNIYASNLASSWVLNYNFYNGDIDSSDKAIATKAKKGTTALLSQDVRQYLATTLNRSVFAEYYSKKFDSPATDGKTYSKNLNNIYTAKGTGIDNGKDYVDSFAEYAASQPDAIANGLTKEDFATGGEPLLNQTYNGKTQEQLIAAINEYADATDIKSSDGDIHLTILLNPDWNATLNKFMEPMFNNFNSIKNNPITVDIVKPVSTAAYDEKSEAAQYDLNWSGWGPDYADPYTYLETYKTDGGMQNYFGGQKFVNNIKTADVYNANTTVQSAAAATMKAFTQYADAIDATDIAGQATTQRYQSFIEAEYAMMYKDFLTTPFFDQAAYRLAAVTRVNRHSVTDVTYGNSAQRSFTLTKTPKVGNFAAYNAADIQFNADKVKSLTDLTYLKENNIFFTSSK